MKVHPELLEPAAAAEGKIGKKFWQERYEDINTFERHLSRNGTLILKFFLNVSKERAEAAVPGAAGPAEKNWKFSTVRPGRARVLGRIPGGYEDAISATSTKWAPWYVVPADHKWVARAVVADIVVGAINGLDLKYPTVSPEAMKALVAARKELEGDGKEPKARKRKRSPASGRG